MTRHEREQAALEWVRPYRLVRHLVRTRDWALQLAPDASEALVLAALTHDIERHFPGGPTFDPSAQAPDDFEYRWQHCVRSALAVEDWLYRHRATDALVEEVQALILFHELGGDEVADILQAADSLSFLETNVELVAGWVVEGLCSPERARAQHRWMYDRIRLPGARDLARPYLERALSAVRA